MRLGPSKLTFWGVFQPVLDGVKLLVKEFLHILFMQRILLFLSSAGLLFIFLVFWCIILSWGKSGIFLGHILILLLFTLLGCGSYFVILVGWACTRVFSKLGSLRSLLQSLSFEVALVLILLIPIIPISSLIVVNRVFLGGEMFLWVVVWLIVCLIESNRAPFDLLEGERELIRGFNIEASSVPFVFIFLSEYGILLSLSLIARLGLFGAIRGFSMFCIIALLFVRRCFPRVRYDVIMSIIWQRVLPIRLLPVLVLVILK